MCVISLQIFRYKVDSEAVKYIAVLFLIMIFIFCSRIFPAERALFRVVLKISTKSYSIIERKIFMRKNGWLEVKMELLIETFQITIWAVLVCS